MFYCREKELYDLNKRYNRGKFECAVVYGRRRVGKTALINEFCKDKPTVFFSALSATAKENLEALSKAVYCYSGPEGMNAPVYNSFDDAFDAITALAETTRLVFVIDEYPYLAKSEPSISSRLQHLIDKVWQNSRIFLILCGSSMSFMENQVLGYESPLYGRRTAQYRISALTYREVAVFNPSLTPEQQAMIYGITGGIPHYINKLDVNDDFDDAVMDNIFNTSAYLFEEPENLLKQELREPAVYNSIIAAVAGGASRVNEISTKTSLDTAVCVKYLKTLIELGILKKESPVQEKNSKKVVYSIDDNFFRFWYCFVQKNMSAIVSGRFSQIYEKAVKNHYHNFMGQIFEKMCREYLLCYADNLPVLIADAGQWWGTDPQEKKEVQIDIVCPSVEGKEYIIGSCKYKNEKTGIDELELIKHYAEVFGYGEKYYFYIFSKGGFTEGLKNAEKEGLVTLISLDDMYK